MKSGKSVFLFFLFFYSIGKAQDITTVAGNGYCCTFYDNVPATAYSIYYPTSVAFDNANNMYIAEANRIRLVKTNDTIYTIAGTFGGYNGDGGLATSCQMEAYAVAVDHNGNIYAADAFHDVIRKINTSGIITTYAGHIGATNLGDGGPATAAKLGGPYDIAVDAAGNLYIADTDDNRIRKVNAATGIISTLAGNGSQGYSGDNGPAVNAVLYEPIGICLDNNGNIFIADHFNNCIRKINTSGVITTVAGNGTPGFSGDGGPATSAQLKRPSDVAVDAFGNMYIADEENQRIRKVDAAGIITTIAGNTYNYSGDGGPAINAEFKQPWGITIDNYGSLYIADHDDSRIRKIYNLTGINETSKGDDGVKILPNPSTGRFYISVSGNHSDKLSIVVYDVAGKAIEVLSSGNEQLIDLSHLPAGIYYLRISAANAVINKKLVLSAR